MIPFIIIHLIKKGAVQINMGDLVIVKGAGDIATGVAHRLFRCGFSVVMTEIESPTCIRRSVSFANAIYEKSWEVEGIVAKRVDSLDELNDVLLSNSIPVIVDPDCGIRQILKPNIIVDAIIAKRNTGTSISDAPIVIGLGPGLIAGEDVHAVVETMRGHNLGRVITRGVTIADTGVPGEIGGHTYGRILRSSKDGKLINLSIIGDKIKIGHVVAKVEDELIYAHIDGILRGLIHDGIHVTRGMKIGDIDPRDDTSMITTISDKARSIAGGVLEAILVNMKG